MYRKVAVGMSKILVLGHKSPDTDSICSAIVYADVKQQLGVDAQAARLGEINKETRFVLDYFGVSAPMLLETVADVAKEVILVDHNERQQSASDIDKVQVVEVLDHHRIANFETGAPLYYRAEPVGCTSTLIYKIYREKNLAIPEKFAGLLLSAIVSDTLLMKSPTCTDEDREAMRELAKLADVDLEEYGLQMLKAGTDVLDKTVDELAANDAKEFKMGSRRVKIAQVNVIDFQDVLQRQQDLEAKLQEVIHAEDLDLFLYVVTNILNSDSVAIALGSSKAVVETAFKVQLVNNTAVLKGVVSRKKQIVPVLTAAVEALDA